MRLSTSARQRHKSRSHAGVAGKPIRLRLAASMLGLAMVGSLGVGSMVSAQAGEPVAEASSVAAAEGTPSTPALETTTEGPAAAVGATESGAPAAGVNTVPAEDPATTEEVAATEDAAAPTDDEIASSPAAEEVPAGDSIQQAPAAPAAPALKEAPAVKALAATPPLTCASGVVYTIDSGGKIRQVNTGSGAQTEIGTISSSYELNGFALTKNGNFGYAVPTTRDSGNDMTVYRYESSSGKTKAYDGVQNISSGGTFVMGGINPATGIYYYGRVLNAKLELYAFDTEALSSIGFVGSIPVSNDSGWFGGTARSNGDLVFSSDGNMYFVASSNTTQSDSNVLMAVDQKLPTTAGNISLTASKIVNLNINGLARQFNGIAFEGGYLYLDTSAGHLYKVNPSDGAIVGSGAIASNLSSPVDMASCQYNNTLQVQKNIVARAAGTDQFTLKASVASQVIGAEGTTKGTSTGVQTGEGTFASSVPISGTTIRIEEVGASGTNLSQYASTWICTNQTGNTVASGLGISGTFVFPAQSGDGVNVTCVFTNQPLSAKVTVIKTWVNAVDGDTASFTANTQSGSSTAPTNGNVITANFAQGTKVNVAEVLASTNKGVYTTTLKCTNAAGTSVGTVEQGGMKGSFTLGASNVTCTYTNTNASATLVVAKKWIVDGVAYNNGQQPAGISAALALAGATAPEWGTVYTGYSAGNTATIAETTTIDPTMACKVTDSQVTLANGTVTSGKVPYAAVLRAGANTYTVTNTVECTTALTLLKFIDGSNGGTLVPGDFTLTAKPSTGPALEVTGANTVAESNTKSVTAGLNYTLSESSDSKPAYLQLSLQRYTGTFNPDGSLANSQAWADVATPMVSVKTGHHEVYRFVNASAPTMTLPLTGGTGSIAYLLVGGGLLLLALLATAWILVRRGRANRA